MMIAGCRWTDERYCCPGGFGAESHLLSCWITENGSLTRSLPKVSMKFLLHPIKKTSDRLQYYMRKNVNEDNFVQKRIDECDMR